MEPEIAAVTITRSCVYQRSCNSKLARNAGGLKVNEHYLRNDIPCNSQRCVRCKNNTERVQLSPIVSHYFVPCVDVLSYFLDVLQSCATSSDDSVKTPPRDFLILQTVLQQLKQNSTQRQRIRVREFMNNPLLRCAFFCNENSIDTFFPRDESSNDSFSSYVNKLVFHSIRWYKKHVNNIVAKDIRPVEVVYFFKLNFEFIFLYQILYLTNC